VIAALASGAAIVVVVVVTKDEKGKVLQTSLTKDKEDALRAVIEGIYRGHILIAAAQARDPKLRHW
jgi:gas vesicle protein